MAAPKAAATTGLHQRSQPEPDEELRMLMASPPAAPNETPIMYFISSTLYTEALIMIKLV
jgi:hypothetical protein